MPTENQIPAEAPRQARAEEILCKALRAFAERGFSDTDVQVIADQVGIGKGTVYRHFGSKEGLFLACAQFARKWLTCQVNQAADQAGTPLEKLRSGMYAFISFFDAHPEVVELRFPVLIEEHSIRHGSGGAGRFRGGDGALRRVRFLQPLTAAILAGRRRVAPYGMAGGSPGETGRTWVERADGTRDELDYSEQTQMQAGDVFVVSTPSGGGYGSAAGGA